MEDLLEDVLEEQGVIPKNPIIDGLFKDYSTLVKWKPILSASFSRLLSNIYSGAPIMIISAYKALEENENPSEEDIEKQYQFNEFQTKRLLNDIKNYNLSYTVVKGYYTYKDAPDNMIPEKSCFVVGITRDGEIMNYDDFKQIALELCGKYEQESVLIGRCINGYGERYSNKISGKATNYNNFIREITDKNRGTTTYQLEDKINDNVVIEYGYYDRKGCVTDEFSTITVKSNKDIQKMVEQAEKGKGIGYTQYKNNNNFVLSDIKVASATIMNNNFLDRITGDCYINKNYGLYFLKSKGEK